MRVWAGRYSPPDPEGAQREAFNCQRECTLNGEFLEYEQNARNCALPWFHTGQWTGEKLWPIRLNRPPDYSRQHANETSDERFELGEWHSPKEDLSSGCPGSMYRGAFLQSLLRYRRRPAVMAPYGWRTEPRSAGLFHGGRIANPMLDACDNPLVHEAVSILEQLEDTAQQEARLHYERIKQK